MAPPFMGELKNSELKFTLSWWLKEKMRVRKATEKDLPELSRLYRGFWNENSSLPRMKSVYKRISNNEFSILQWLLIPSIKVEAFVCSDKLEIKYAISWVGLLCLVTNSREHES